MIQRCKIGKKVKIPYPKLVNLYKCKIGDGSFIGPFVEIQKDVVIGKNCRIQSHSFICEGVTIGDNVFVGHGVMFVNDLLPRVDDPDRKLKKTFIGSDVSIGTNSTLLPVIVGKNSVIGAGSVVTKNVEIDTIVVGNPAREVGINVHNY